MANYQRSRKLKFFCSFRERQEQRKLRSLEVGSLVVWQTKQGREFFFIFIKSKTFGKADKTFHLLSF